ETQRAFMREARALIGEKRLVRTHALLATAIESQILAFSGLKTELEKLKKTASCPRDQDDIQHLERVLNRVREITKVK
ncbi:MAG: hypothetical protein AB1715_09125, partial [Acidobacteriota bacterium]